MRRRDVAEVSRVLGKCLAIYRVALSVHLYCLLALPFHVSTAMFRSITGVPGVGIDELFARQFSGDPGESFDTALLKGLREKHKLAQAALNDQLDDADGRYKTVYEKLRDSERMRHKMQRRLTAAQEELILSGNRVPESPRGSVLGGERGTSFKKAEDDWDSNQGKNLVDHDKIPVYVTTFACVIALLYFYDINDAPAFDKKLAMLAPGTWMTVLGMKRAALSKALICGNLVFFGYLVHILVQHKRELGMAPSSAIL